MGEYWKPVNVTRKQYIHPHRVDEGLKLAEWTWSRDSHVLTLALRLGWSVRDDIRIVSDYGGDLRVTDAAKASEAEIGYDSLGERFADVRTAEPGQPHEEDPELVAAIIRAAAPRVPYPEWRAQWTDLFWAAPPDGEHHD